MVNVALAVNLMSCMMSVGGLASDSMQAAAGGPSQVLEVSAWAATFSISAEQLTPWRQ